MLARVQTARRRVAAVCAALRSPSPEEILSSLPALEQAISSLHEIEQELLESGSLSKPPELRGTLQGLKRDIRLAQRLAENGAALARGWAKLLAGAAGGYVATGEPVPLHASATVSIEA
jgi:hypothetical protein